MDDLDFGLGDLDDWDLEDEKSSYSLSDLMNSCAPTMQEDESNKGKFERISLKRSQEIILKMRTFANLSGPVYKYDGRRDRARQLIGCFKEMIGTLEEKFNV